MSDKTPRATSPSRRRLVLLGLIALLLWIVGITLFLLTNHSVLPYLQYQVTSRVPQPATATTIPQPTATQCVATADQPCVAPTATPAPAGTPLTILPAVNTSDAVGFAASVISIIGAIPPTFRFFRRASRVVRRRSGGSPGAA